MPAGDQIYILVTADGNEVKGNGIGKSARRAIKRGDPETVIDVNVPFNSNVTITVMEYDGDDNNDDDDNLGTINAKSDSGSKSLRGGKNAGKWDYDVSWAP